MYTTYSHKSRPKTKPEVNSGEIKVERAGYLSTQKRIEALMLAGERLLIARSEQYDEPDEDGEYQLDPTRNPNYDLADAAQDAMAVSERLKRARVRAKTAPKTEPTASPGGNEPEPEK